MFKNKKSYLIAPIILLLLFPPTVLAAGQPQQQNGSPPASSNSVTILIDGVPVEGAIAKDNVVHQGERINGECDNPSITIRARGDLRRVKVGPDGDTCNLVVKTLDLNTTVLPNPDSQFLTAKAYKWRLHIESTIEGIQPEGDDLTRTRSKFTFKTPSFTNSGSLFDGGGIYSKCWARYAPPIYLYRSRTSLPPTI